MDFFEKSQTVDPEVRAHVYSLVNAVGGQSTYDERYAIGDDALAVLNDLLRWLRLYDDKTNRYDVKRCLAEANLVKGDLLEILALWPEEAQENKWKAKLALACLQLIVSLTWPMEVSGEETTKNHVRHMPTLQLAQVDYKRAVLHYEDAQILRTAVRIGLPAMAVERRERSRRDEGIIKLMLLLFRNMAMIVQPQNLPSQGDENEISRSATISSFVSQDVFSLLLTVGSGCGDEFQEHDVIVLETLFHLLKGVDAKKLFMEKEQLADEEINELQSLMQKEKAMLNSHNKHAPTRHHRFGTMLWVKREDKKFSTVTGQNSITNASTTLQQMDASKKYVKPKFRGKLTLELNETSDFGMRVDLTEKARKQLRSFVEDFLDSSFNPLFSSLRKAIERETERVTPSNHKQFWYMISWFLTAEAARRDSRRRDSAWHADRPSQINPEDNTFAYVAAVLDQETFVLLNRHMQRAFDEKSWQDLQSTLLAFTQILLTVQNMAESPDEEDQEIAENIQQRIFYEETTHDRMVAILRGYTHQGFAYLDAVTESIHVFVRMLERYSKQNVDLQIRSKRRSRKKQKKQLQASGEAQNGNDDAEDAAEDEREAHLAVSERKFDFARFSSKFLSQQCVNTFIALLNFYTDLSPAQLKRCHRYFYRLAFKHELAIFLFRVDILALLHRMIKGPNGLNPEVEGFKDWEQLVQQIFRRCIKWLEREQAEGEGWKEACVVEMLFSKIPPTLFYLQNGYDRVVEKRPPRPPAELEIKKSVASEEQRVGVAVSLMLEKGRADAVEWVKKELVKAVEERQAWEDGQRNAHAISQVEREMDSEMPDLGASIPAPTIFLSHDSDERKAELFKDKFLRLLLTTIGMQRLGTADDVDASWIVPSELSSEELQKALESIRKAEHDPPVFEDGKNAMDLVRNKSAGRRGATFSDTESGGTDSDDDGEALFPPNLKEKRKDGEQPAKKKRRLTRRNRTELTDEQVAERAQEKKKREKERNGKIKSQLYVTGSDDESDEEMDAEFYRREEAQRQKTAGFIRQQLLKEAGGKKRKAVGSEGESEGAVGRKKKKVKQVETGNEESDAETHAERIMTIGDALADYESPVSSPVWQGMRIDSSSEEEDGESQSSDMEDDVPEAVQRPAPRKRALADSDEESGGDEETPSTSPTAMDLDRASADTGLPLTEVSGNVVTEKTKDRGDVEKGRLVDAVENGDDEEDDVPLAKSSGTHRRTVRAGFIIDDDSDEE